MATTGIPTPTRQISSTPSPSSPAVAVRVKQLSPATRHSRRTSLLLLLHLPSLSSPPPASSLGISGPKEWLKDQKKKTSKFILAPVKASRSSLQDAFSILSTKKVEVEGDVRKLLNSAARDCVADDRSSIVAFQAQTGVEVCTFSLLVKNAASLLDDNDPVKLDTEARLDELVRSFSSLGSLIDTSDLQLPSDRRKVEARLEETMLALDNFELGIKNCLGV